jgi:Xaa-Pro dipeptidase
MMEKTLPDMARFLPSDKLSRRQIIDSRQANLNRLMAERSLDAVILFETANFRWFTAGAAPRGLMAEVEIPAIYLHPQQRWIIASAVDSARFFDQDLDEYGFQLKEFGWPVHRDELLRQWVGNRKIGVDRPLREMTDLTAELFAMRRILDSFAIDHLKELGKKIVHAVEATLRTISTEQSDFEIAAQVHHRIIRHGAYPTHIQVIGDESLGKYPRIQLSGKVFQHAVTIVASAEFRGLHATVARTLSWNQPSNALKQAHERASQLTAIYPASCKFEEPISDALLFGKRFLRTTDFEDDWRKHPPAYLTGYQPVEWLIRPGTNLNLHPGLCIVWQAHLGEAISVDTFLAVESGWETITPVEDWPIRRFVIDGKVFNRPEILVRKDGESVDE